jgi:DNA polymerase-1
MMKLAMIRVFDRMKAEGLQSLLMMQVHDELVFEAREDEVDALRRLVVTEMEAALPLPGVPVRVDTGVGSSWYEAH